MAHRPSHQERPVRRAVGAMLGLIVLAIAAAPALHATAPGTKVKGDIVLGRKLFRSNCGTCHTLGPAGTHGHIGPNLGLDTHQYATVVWMIRNGDSVMPAFTSMLKKAEIADVAAYVSTVAGN